MLNYWILIGLLAASTYISRIIGIEIMAGREMNATLRLYFNYVPIGIISALIIKQIVIPMDGQLAISFPVLIGCLSTAVTIKVLNMFLPSVMIGAILGWAARYCMS
ncbi:MULTISPECIES: AzlD domain-containing protein [Pelosinus]|nr:MULTISPECIES: AzlD domain-containing protein [Pelosinus]